MQTANTVAAGMAGLEAGEFLLPLSSHIRIFRAWETEKTAEDTAEDRIQFLVRLSMS